MPVRKAALPVLTVKVKGMTAIKAILTRRIKRLENFYEPLTQIVKDFYDTEEFWFRSKGQGRWKPLSKTYAIWKGKVAPGKPIMRLTDRMWREFTGQPGHYQIRKSGARVFIQGADYWVKHQYGTDRAQRRTLGGQFSRGFSGAVPRRELIATPMIELRKKAWKRLMIEWLEARLDVTPEKLLASRK